MRRDGDIARMLDQRDLGGGLDHSQLRDHRPGVHPCVKQRQAVQLLHLEVPRQGVDLIGRFQQPEKRRLQRRSRQHSIEPCSVLRVGVLGPQLPAGENLTARVMGWQEQNLFLRRQHHHRAGLLPSGKIEEIRLLKEADMQILGLLRAKENHHAVERFPQLRTARLILLARDALGRQKHRNTQQTARNPHVHEYSFVGTAPNECSGSASLILRACL